MKFTYVPVASILHDKLSRQAIMASYDKILRNAGGTLLAPGPDGLPDVSAAPEDQPLVYFILTGGTEKDALAFRAIRAAKRPDEPVWILAHPYQNSLPASLEILAKVRRDGGTGRVFFMSGPDDVPTMEAMERAVRVREAMKSLPGKRLGRVGASSDWLVASSHDGPTVDAAWGVDVVPVDIDQLHRYVAEEGAPESGPEYAFFDEAVEIREPDRHEIGQAIGVYRALKRIVEEHRLDALTLRCFDLVLDEKTTGCFALSRLNDEGVIAGCEGDIPAALALLWTREVTGQLGWMSNPARVDAKAGKLLLAHCTVPRSIVGRYTIRSHFESSLGVGISGELERGPMTLVRLGGAALDRLWITEGSILATPAGDGLCRTQIECDVPPEALESMLSDPLGNHVVVVPGLHEADLREAFALNAARVSARSAVV